MCFQIVWAAFPDVRVEQGRPYWDKSSAPKENDDLKLHPILFKHLNHMWEPHTVDLFATSKNVQLHKYSPRRIRRFRMTGIQRTFGQILQLSPSLDVVSDQATITCSKEHRLPDSLKPCERLVSTSEHDKWDWSWWSKLVSNRRLANLRYYWRKNNCCDRVATRPLHWKCVANVSWIVAFFPDWITLIKAIIINKGKMQKC